MKMLNNQVILIGNLGKDPTIRSFESGSSKAQFSLATSDSYINKAGERVTQTDWHNVIAWGPTAQLLEKHGSKGRRLALIGKLTSRKYQDKEGQTRFITEVDAQEIIFMDKEVPAAEEVTPTE
jgi:single-strand DNA-binding protein